MDDSRVTQVGLQNVMRQHAYLLFYTKTVKPRPVPQPQPQAQPQPLTPTKAATAAAPAAVNGKQSPQPQRPKTPGWSDVLAQLREEDAREEDHTKDLPKPKPGKGGEEGEDGAVDTSWTQPEVRKEFCLGERRGCWWWWGGVLVCVFLW